MQTGCDSAKPQCYRPLDEPGGLPCLLLFISLGSNRLRRMTAMPNSGTEPSMAKASWPVQNAFYGRIGHATTESSPTPAAKRLSPTELVPLASAVARPSPADSHRSNGLDGQWQ